MSSIHYHGLQRPERAWTDYGNILTLLELRAVLTIQKAELKKIKWCDAMAALAGAPAPAGRPLAWIGPCRAGSPRGYFKQGSMCWHVAIDDLYTSKRFNVRDELRRRGITAQTSVAMAMFERRRYKLIHILRARVNMEKAMDRCKLMLKGEGCASRHANADRRNYPWLESSFAAFKIQTAWRHHRSVLTTML